MKRVTADINVSTREGAPYLINWSGKTYVVRRVIEKRIEKNLLSKKEFFRLETDKEDLEVSSNGKGWKLERVLEPGESFD
jgi:hypothetical protein